MKSPTAEAVREAVIAARDRPALDGRVLKVLYLDADGNPAGARTPTPVLECHTFSFTVATPLSDALRCAAVAADAIEEYFVQ